MIPRPFAPGTLWPAILRQTAHALRCGALLPIETVQTVLDDGGVRFRVRQVSSLASKPQPRPDSSTQPGTHPADPFLPHDPDLFVADISPTHLALLNKFNVIDHHLLIVTRHFIAQEALLDLADFTALFTCLAEFDGLGFYNGGSAAGASQSHKHLQTVPLAGLGGTLPVAPLLDALPAMPTACADGAVGTVPGLPFPHAYTPLAAPPTLPPARMARVALARYRQLLDAVGIRAIDVGGEAHQSAPYNLLIFPRGMLLVPRAAEHVAGISINALAFAGSLFVRDAAQMETVAALGPMAVLRQAAGAA